MWIISVEEDFDGRSSTLNGMFERTLTRVFYVETSDKMVGHFLVRTAVDPTSGLAIPHIGATYNNGLADTDPLYEFDNGAFVNNVKVDQDGSPTNWKVTIEYGPFNTAEFGADPTEWKTIVQVAGEEREKVLDFDKAGVPIRNSARDRFGEPVTVEDSVITLAITRNVKVSDFELNIPSTFNNTTNTAEWNGFPARTCKMGIISTSDPKWAPDVRFWYYTVTYPVKTSRTEWVKTLLDQGYNQLNSSNLPEPITRNGQPLSDPAALDGAGHELAPTADPVPLTFDVYDEADWTALGIDLSTRLGA